MQPSINKIKNRIFGHGRGWVFTADNFLDIASRAAIDNILSRLVRRGTIRRLARGLYDFPKKHKILGKLLPRPEQVAIAIAGKEHLRLQPSGAYAANLLGLTNQVPAKIIFLTDGHERSVTIEKQSITLKKTTPKNMATAGRISGLVIQALRYIGKQHVNDEIIEKLARRLSKKDKQQLHKDIRFAPIWIGEIFRQLSKGKS
jgi:hypothetical protein